MKQKQLQKKYSELLKSGDLATGRKETISYYHKAAKLRSKIYKKSKITCNSCNGIGFRRISIEVTKTCLFCCGRGFLLNDSIKI
tara:strand:+ start:50 stop:301 length:252 start_codon:yes stop_codon:yes gene_type:complete